MIDFISQISGLILIPENQSKSVIFQAIISTALSLKPEEMKSDMEKGVAEKDRAMQAKVAEL